MNPRNSLAATCHRRLVILACSLTLNGSLAAESMPAESKTVQAQEPWSERALANPMSSADFSGRLDQQRLQTLIDAGEHLFTARFTTLDGVGRPMATQAIIPTKRKRAPRSAFSRTAGMDANACSSCHNVPLVGGAGDFTANVFVSEGFQHTDFDTTDPQFSNERNTNHLFGSGLIELLAREMSGELQALRTQALRTARESGEPTSMALSSKGVNFGQLHAWPDGRVATHDIEGVDQDLVIRPFSHKGVMTSLRQFTINALNHHHGMQATERFGERWTGQQDHDEDGVRNELGPGDVSALVAWQAALPPPGRLSPADERWQNAAARGERHFRNAGCNDCHRRTLPLDSLDFADPGHLDAAGTLRHAEATDATYPLALLAWAKQLERDDSGRYLIPLFGDLKRHRIADQSLSALGNELLSQRFVERNVFMTSELWGIASTAPYGHRGDMSTLAEVIDAHGGEARSARDAWSHLNEQQKSDMIAFLKTLVIAP